MWKITDRLKEYPTSLSPKFTGNKFIFYSSDRDTDVVEKNPNNYWFHSGHIFNRNKGGSNSSRKLFAEDIECLYSKDKEEFGANIKGSFIVGRLNKNEFDIFGDHFGLKKFFIYQNDCHFIISDELSEITKHVQADVSCETLAIYSLTYHFTGGITAFENVKHNRPGERIAFINGQLKFDQYWKPEELLNLNSQSKNINDIADHLMAAVSSSAAGSKADQISLSLTGGADTRNLLAVFLNQDIKPHLYTYGHPKSNDCIKARAIAEGLGLAHEIHDISFDAEIFEIYARKIVRQSGGLASIHRTHRLLAVEQEAKYAKIMFLGTLGGEFIKGVSEDDYIVPAIVYENWENPALSQTQLRKYLVKKCLKEDALDLGCLIRFLNAEPYMQGSVTTRKFNALSYITAHLHDAQDVNLYQSVMNHVFTPFLDPDYLDVLFSSCFTFNNKEEIENKYLKRIENPVYGANFLKVVYPPLLSFKYSGEHIPSEVLQNKYLAALTKAIRQKTRRSYPPNFPLGQWMIDFVAKNLPVCNDYSVLKETFNLNLLLKEFNSGNHRQNESYWLKFTNPVMMRFIIEEFGGKSS